MIEMLGVLAIIGILSAGGIMGYSAAMDAYTFNKFVKDTQTMAAATLSVFPKPHTRTTNIKWVGEALNRLGILPNELYKTAPSPTSEYVKNPFTEKIDWNIRVYEYRSGGGSFSTNLGTATLPAQSSTFFEYFLPVPKKICVKILTHNWQGLTSAWYSIRNHDYSTTYRVVSPLSVKDAETICNYESNYLVMSFFLHSRALIWE